MSRSHLTVPWLAGAGVIAGAEEAGVEVECPARGRTVRLRPLPSVLIR